MEQIAVTQTPEEKLATRRKAYTHYRDSGRALEVQRAYRQSDKYQAALAKYKVRKAKLDKERKQKKKLPAQVSLLLVNGMTNAQILEELNISYHTLVAIKREME